MRLNQSEPRIGTMVGLNKKNGRHFIEKKSDYSCTHGKMGKMVAKFHENSFLKIFLKIQVHINPPQNENSPDSHKSRKRPILINVRMENFVERQ